MAESTRNLRRSGRIKAKNGNLDEARAFWSPSNPQKQCWLTRLPLEISEMIFEYALAFNETPTELRVRHKEYWMRSTYPPLLTRDVQNPMCSGLALLRSCQVFCNIGRLVLSFSNVHTLIYSNFMPLPQRRSIAQDYFSQLSSEQLRAVRHLHIFLETYHHDFLIGVKCGIESFFLDFACCRYDWNDLDVDYSGL